MSQVKIFYAFCLVTIIFFVILMTPSSYLAKDKVIYSSLIFPLIKKLNSSLGKVRLSSSVLNVLNEYSVIESNNTPGKLNLSSLTFQKGSKKEILKNPLTKFTEHKTRGKMNSKRRSLSIFEEIQMASLKMIPENDCFSPFVTIIKRGRLGNKICQLMTLLLLRQYFGIRIAVFPVMFGPLNKLFENISVPIVANPCFYPDKSSYFEVNSHVLFEILFSRLVRREKNTSFFGKNYSTDLKYYNYISNHARPFINNFLVDRKFLKSQLKIKKLFLDKAKNRIEKAITAANFHWSNITLVSIHVRRTDYIRYVQIRNSSLPQVSYYIKAMEFYRKRCHRVLFLVVSDDKEWVQTWLSARDVLFPGDFNISSPQTDFSIMTLCDHHIIGLGTFAYASALLGKGTIISFTPQKIPNFLIEDVPDSCNLSDEIIYMND